MAAPTTQAGSSSAGARRRGVRYEQLDEIIVTDFTSSVCPLVSDMC
jgi:hypothetical protein